MWHPKPLRPSELQLSQQHQRGEGCCLVFGQGLEGCKKGLSEAPLLPGGMDISLSHLDHCMATGSPGSSGIRLRRTESSTSGGATTSALPGGTAAPNLGNPVLDALVLGMQQLQTLQANQLNTPKKEDAPESVKTGITALPKLAPPDPSGGSLDFQDWLQQISGLMSDFSDSSQVWWSAVVQVSKDAYDRWVTASPIERLQVEPDDRTELTEGKWGRVNARACSMLLEADPAVKSDIIARKANQAAPKILFRLYTTYQPGGTGERNLVLTNLQNPSAVHDATSGVSALRA